MSEARTPKERFDAIVAALGTPYYTDGKRAVYCSDCRELLPRIEPGSVDLVLTDPEYGIGVTKQNLGIGKRQFHRGDWDAVRSEGVADLISLAPLACIWGGNYFADLLPPTNDWLIWHKANDGRSFSECEMAWTNYGRQTRHLTHHWGGEEKRHPTQKPLAVIKWALTQAPEEPQVILDPYGGSGTTLEAAKQLGRFAIYIDQERPYCEVARKRLRQSVLEFAETESA